MHEGFGFRRLVERLTQIIPDGIDVLWQVGSTDTAGLGIESHVTLPTSELNRAMADSDVVITHAGIGSVMSAIQAGKRPVIVPRRKRFKEHVDDHQAGIAAELERRALVFYVEADELQWADIARAASWRVGHDGGREPAHVSGGRDAVASQPPEQWRPRFGDNHVQPGDAARLAATSTEVGKTQSELGPYPA